VEKAVREGDAHRCWPKRGDRTWIAYTSIGPITVYDATEVGANCPLHQMTNIGAGPLPGGATIGAPAEGAPKATGVAARKQSFATDKSEEPETEPDFRGYRIPSVREDYLNEDTVEGHSSFDIVR
jgi:hypothetical protein